MKVKVHYEAKTLHAGRGGSITGGGILGYLSFELSKATTQEEAEKHVTEDKEFISQEIRKNIKSDKKFAAKIITDLTITKVEEIK